MARSRLEKGRKAGSKIAQTRHENGTNQARKMHEPSSKPARKILRFDSFRLEAGNAKWVEPWHDRRIDVTQMTGNYVRKAYIKCRFTRGSRYAFND